MQEAAFHILYKRRADKTVLSANNTLYDLGSLAAQLHRQTNSGLQHGDETSCNNLKGVGLLSLLFDCRQYYICTDVTRIQIKDRSS